MSPRHFRWLAAGCFFLTGATSLVYQLVWSRYLTLAFGAAQYSVATVVAAYMLGLGLGAWLLGHVADRSQRPARLYALLELAIAAYGLGSPWVLRMIEKGFVGWHQATGPGPTTALAMKLVLALLALALPTILMGGTLPVLSRALVSDGRAAAADVGSLYAWNTLGAVAGAAFAGFVLIEQIGLARSLLLAAMVNAFAALAVLVARPGAAPTPPVMTRAPLAELVAGRSARFALVAAFLAGFASLADEIVWTRVLALLTGSSTWSFTVILTTFLLGIGLGAAWSARHPAANPALRLAWAQIIAAAGAGVLLVLYEPAARIILASGQNPLASWWSLFALRALIAAVAVIPATFGFGASFPALVALIANDQRRTGSAVGLVYAANTAGAILGSLASGFVLMRWFSSYTVLLTGVLMSLGIASGALLLAQRDPGAAPRRYRLLPAVSLLLLALTLLSRTPWPPHLLDLGVAVYLKNHLTNWIDLNAFMERGRSQGVFLREGPVSTVTVRDAGHTRFLRVNGKTDASTSGDMGTQLVVGILPALEHRTARSALVIGAGSGVTVRALAESPGIETVDVVEIEPAVIEAGRYFEDVNQGVYRRKGVTVHIEDGRNHLLTARRTWDIIVSEPSNPWMSGVANLFTTQYYDLARSRLAPGGVFCQWLQRYDLTENTFRRLLATLLARFPHVELWRAGPGDAVLLAALEPLELDLAHAGRVLDASFTAHPGELQAFLGLESVEDLPSLYVLGEAGLRKFAGDARPYSDDPPELEFAAFRDLHGDPRWAARSNLALMETKRELRDGAPAANPPFPPALRAFGMGRVLLSMQETGPADLLFQQSLGLSPSARVWRWLGEVRHGAGNPAAAEAAWQQALELNPGDRTAAVRLARAALSRGDAAAAHALLPDPSGADFAIENRFLRAELALAERRFPDALNELDETWALHRLSPDPAALFDRMQPLYARLGLSDAAPDATIARLREKIAAEPRHIEWRLVLAQTLERPRRCPEIVAELDWLDQHGARSVDMLLRRGQCLLEMGEYERARSAWTQAAAEEPWRVDLGEIDRRRGR